MGEEKESREVMGWKNRWMYIGITLGVTVLLFLTVHGTEGVSEGISGLPNQEGTYVIEDVLIDYAYDEDNMEVIRLSNAPYVVIKGDQKALNMLKWQGDPSFHVDLRGREPGRYRETIEVQGVPEELGVEFSPKMVDVRLMEQETLSVEPVIEVVGKEQVSEEYIVSVPEKVKEEVRIRDTQDVLDRIGSVKAVVDVSGWTRSRVVSVPLEVFDREGKKMNDVNVIDGMMDVRVPVEKKVTVVEEEVVKDVVQREPKTTEEVFEEGVDEEKEGKVSFRGVGDRTLEVLSQEGNLTEDVVVNVTTFSDGKYEVDVGGVKVTFKISGGESNQTEEEEPKEGKEEVAVEGNEKDTEDASEEEKGTDGENKEENEREREEGLEESDGVS